MTRYGLSILSASREERSQELQTLRVSQPSKSNSSQRKRSPSVLSNSITYFVQKGASRFEESRGVIYFSKTFEHNIKSRPFSSRIFPKMTASPGMWTPCQTFDILRMKIVSLLSISSLRVVRTIDRSRSRRISRISRIASLFEVESLRVIFSIHKKKSSTERRHHIDSTILRSDSMYISTRGADIFSRRQESKISSQILRSTLSSIFPRRPFETVPSVSRQRERRSSSNIIHTKTSAFPLKTTSRSLL